MKNYTDQELHEARNKCLKRLREIGNYTGSYVRPLGGGRFDLVVQYHPVTPDIRQAVLEAFAGYPVEVVDRPLASASVLRLPK